jgi:hypothetical protein
VSDKESEFQTLERRDYRVEAILANARVKAKRQLKLENEIVLPKAENSSTCSDDKPDEETSVTYEEALQALEDRFGDQHFAAAYRSQLKARTQRTGESLREFATAIEQLAYRAYPTLPEEHIRREAGCAFVDGVEDTDIKIKLCTEKSVNKALRQALELQAVFLDARPQKIRANTFWGSRSPLTRKRKAKQSGCWSCGKSDHFKSNCSYGRKTVNDRRWRNKGRQRRKARESTRRPEWQPSCNEKTNMKCG